LKHSRKLKKRENSKVKGSKVTDCFVVYVVSLEGKILYIGSGVPTRHHHVTSGCSHVYELNRLHFEGKVVDVEIVKQTTSKQEALDIEKRLIVLNKPTFNTMYNSDKVSKMKNMLHDKWLCYFQIFEKSKRDRFSKILCEAVNCFGINALTTGKGMYIKDLSSRKMIPHCIIALCTAKRRKNYEHFKELHEIMCIHEGYLFLPTELPEYSAEDEIIVFSRKERRDLRKLKYEQRNK